MTGAKQILLAGFAAMSLLLSACRSTSDAGVAEAPPLIVSPRPLTSASYTAEYTQDGALPFTCEVKLGTNGRIRRDYIWKDDNGADRRVSVVIAGEKAFKFEDGKATDLMDADTAQARFFAGLVLAPDTVISGTGGKIDAGKHSSDGVVPCRTYAMELKGVSGVESCIAATDPKSDLWSGLTVRMSDDPDRSFSTSFHRYESESGVTYPSQIVSSTGNGAQVRCVVRDVKINPELPDELFRLPDTNG